MKNLTAVFFCLFLSFGILSAQDAMGKKDEMKKDEMKKVDMKKDGMKKSGMMKKGAMYCCPHHPEVKSDKPGKCSRCGMDLSMAGDGMKKHDMMKKDEMKKDEMKK